MADRDLKQEREEPWYEKHKQWIKGHIEQRECIIFSRETDDICICNKEKKLHKNEKGNKKWKRDVNTVTEPTKFYGTTLASHQDAEGNTDKLPIEVIRLDEETPLKDVRHLLFEVWNLPHPKWIFCLLGESIEKDHLHKSLRTAFEKVSVTTDLWCLTDGMDDTLSDNVQLAKTEAEKDGSCRITSLACNSWGELSNIQELTQTEESRRVEVSLEDYCEKGGTACHFLLVDNGTEEPYLCYLSTVAFYTKLVASLASPQDASSAIPVIAVFHGGEELILLEYVKNLIKENIPVLVIKNSGGVADLVCQAYGNSKGHTKSSSRDTEEGQVTVIDQQVKTKIKLLAETFDEDESEESLQTILQCLQRRDLITVVDGEDEDEDMLFNAIISAIVKPKTSAELNALVDDYLPTPVYSRKTKERADRHVEEMKKDDSDKVFFGSQKIVNAIFLEALLREKTGCVEFLLETDAVDIIEDLDIVALYSKTKRDLQKKVAKTFKDTEGELLVKSAVQQFLDDLDMSQERKNIIMKVHEFLSNCKDKDGKPVLNKETKKKIKKIVKNSKDPQKEMAKFLRTCLERSVDIQGILSTNSQTTKKDEDDGSTPVLIQVFTTKIIQRFFPQTCIQDDHGIEREQLDPDDETETSLRKKRFRHLFVWAVLTNRKETARTLWKHGENLIVSALVAGTVMDYLAERTFNSRKKLSREHSAMFYKQLAMGTIDACYLNAKDTTVNLLNKITKQNVWNVDLLALAFEKKNSCVFQCDGLSYFTHRRWMGGLRKDTSLWRIIVSTLLPIFMWLLIKLPEDKVKHDTKSEINTGKAEVNDKLQDENTMHVDVKGSRKEETRGKRGCCSPCEKIRIFYSAPVVKFILSLLFYLGFIGLYAHFLLVVLKFEFTWNWELPLLVWMAAFTCEELIQMLQFAYERKQDSDKSKTRRKHHHEKNVLKRFFHAVSKYVGIYFQDKWNLLDSVCILGFAIAYPLRWFPVTYNYGRLFFSINFMCFFWKLLQACTPSRSLGPALYMVFRMVGDLLPFLVILLAVIFSYAVATEALMFPNSDFSFAFILGIPRKAFWQIFGEFSFEDIDGSSCDTGPCPDGIGRTWVPLFMAAYVVMTNVLLINLIIARFNHIFEEVRDKTNEVWAWQKCRLMMEYDSKPPFPLPFTIFWRIGAFICWLIRKCLCMGNRRDRYEEKEDTSEESDSDSASEAEHPAVTAADSAPQEESPPLESVDIEHVAADIVDSGEVAQLDDGNRDAGTTNAENDGSDDNDGASDMSSDSSDSTYSWSTSDSSDDSEDEDDNEDPLDIFERQNAEYYLQTERDKHF